MIRSFSPFPFVLPNSRLQSGLLVDSNGFCEQCETRECAKIGYNDRVPGQIRQCFQGINFIRLEDYEHEDIVWMGFLLKGSAYPKNYKALLKKGYELDKTAIDKTANLFSNNGSVHRSAEEMQKRGESRAMHDLKHLISAMIRVVETADVKAVTERAGPASPADAVLMRDTIDSVYSILGAIKNHLALSDFILAPEAAHNMRARPISVFRLFDKSVYMYNVLASQQKKLIEIRSVGGYVTDRELKEPFVLLPAILLQNALKYSLGASSIFVELSEKNKKIEIIVKSTGPVIPEGERERIWLSGARYVHPNDTSKPGSGFGLFLAKSICEQSGFNIRYEGEARFEVNEVPMGENRFIITER